VPRCLKKAMLTKVDSGTVAEQQIPQFIFALFKRERP